MAQSKAQSKAFKLSELPPIASVDDKDLLLVTDFDARDGKTTRKMSVGQLADTFFGMFVGSPEVQAAIKAAAQAAASGVAEEAAEKAAKETAGAISSDISAIAMATVTDEHNISVIADLVDGELD